jgi:hypothetical protein
MRIVVLPRADSIPIRVGCQGRLVSAAVADIPGSGSARLCFSWPRYSLSTVLVCCFGNPSGPVSDRPCSQARRRTSPAAAFSAAVGSFFLYLLDTSSSRIALSVRTLRVPCRQRVR